MSKKSEAKTLEHSVKHASSQVGEQPAPASSDAHVENATPVQGEAQAIHSDEQVQNSQEPVASREAPHESTKQETEDKGHKTVPTLQELVDKGQSRSVAFARLVNHLAKLAGKSKEEAADLADLAKKGVEALDGTSTLEELAEPYYRVTAVTHKFWRIGRPFDTDQLYKVPVSSLTEKQIKELESTNEKFLSVKLITHE